MLSEREIIAHQSIIELHQWIENVFTGREDHPAALDKLLGSFSPAFSMVTTKGQCIGFAEVESLFRSSAGGRPHLRIEIDCCETLQLAENAVVCRYRETHHNEGSVQSRWSVTVIDTEHGQPRWRYLHETLIAD